MRHALALKPSCIQLYRPKGRLTLARPTGGPYPTIRCLSDLCLFLSNVCRIDGPHSALTCVPAHS
jgi:hypothetical protein